MVLGVHGRALGFTLARRGLRRILGVVGLGVVGLVLVV
jgi:hypothetical protein